MDLAGLKDLKLVLGVEWRLVWCGGRFGMNLRGGGGRSGHAFQRQG